MRGEWSDGCSIIDRGASVCALQLFNFIVFWAGRHLLRQWRHFCREKKKKKGITENIESESAAESDCQSKIKGGTGACQLFSQFESQLLWEENIFLQRKSLAGGFRGRLPLNDLIQVRSLWSRLSVCVCVCLCCNPRCEMGAQGWPHCLVSQGLRGAPGEALGPVLTAERSETLTCRPGVRGDRQPRLLLPPG